MENLKVVELQAIAREHSVKGRSKMRKAELIEALREIGITTPPNTLPEEILNQPQTPPIPTPRTNIPKQPQRPIPAPRTKIPQTQPIPKIKNKTLKVAERVKFYDSLTVTTNKNIPNQSQRPAPKIKNKTFKSRGTS